jgi:hypothetical protein
MAFELPDFWTTIGIGLALLSLVPGMTSVPSASHIEFKVSRACAVAAATLFLIKLALWGSEDLTASRLALVAVLGALIAVSAAYALHWIGQKEKIVKVDSPAPAPAPSPHQETPRKADDDPAFVLNNSKATFDNPKIVNDPRGVLQSNNSELEWKGGLVIGKNTDRNFPAPTGEFSSLSNDNLRKIIHGFVGELRSFQATNDQVITGILKRAPHAARDETDRRYADAQNQFEAEFRARLRPKAVSLASEIATRTGPVVLPRERWGMVRMGSAVLLYDQLAGPHPVGAIADFFDFLVEKLPN